MNIVKLIEKAVEAADTAGLKSLEIESTGERLGIYLPPPAELHTDVYRALKTSYPSGLYAHQSRAIQSVLDEEDVCLATPTASGKSLVFMAAAADLLLNEMKSRVLALYPAKALIQDQISKWNKMFEQFAISVGYIDGSVGVDQRYSILRNSRVVLMTPDVLQAWMMANLRRREVADFMSNLKYL